MSWYWMHIKFKETSRSLATVDIFTTLLNSSFRCKTRKYSSWLYFLLQRKIRKISRNGLSLKMLSTITAKKLLNPADFSAMKPLVPSNQIYPILEWRSQTPSGKLRYSCVSPAACIERCRRYAPFLYANLKEQGATLLPANR